MNCFSIPKYKMQQVLQGLLLAAMVSLSSNAYPQLLDFSSPTGIKILPPPGSRPIQSSQGKEKSEAPSPPEEDKFIDRARIFSGISAGWIFAQPKSSNSGFESKSGPLTELKTQLSLRIKKISIESGLGLFFYAVAGSESISASEGNATSTQVVRIYSIGTTMDAGVWYENNAKILFGSAFSLRRPADLAYSSKKSRSGTGIHITAQVARSFETNAHDHRVAFAVGRTFNNSGWSDLHLSLGYQFGFPLKRKIEAVEQELHNVRKTEPISAE